MRKTDAIKIKDHLRVEWERIIGSDNELYNEWQRVTKNDSEWCNNWQGVIRRVRNKEWQRVTTSDNEWQQVVQQVSASKREWFWNIIQQYRLFINKEISYKFANNGNCMKIRWRNAMKFVRPLSESSHYIKIGKNQSLMALSLAPK